MSDVTVEENMDPLESIVGGIWLNFRESIPEAQATILSRGFNLIIEGEDIGRDLSEKLDEDRLAGNSSGILCPLITELLSDDSLSIEEIKAELYELLTNNIIVLLKRLGVTIDEDNVEYQNLETLIDLVEFFFDVDGYEDVIGMITVLEASDTDPVSRLLGVITLFKGEDWDPSDTEILISDVSEMSLEAIRVGLTGTGEEEAVPEFIGTRIQANKEMIVGTQAGLHVISNGRLGAPLDNLMGFFSEVPKLLDNPTPDNVASYVREVIAIYLISELNTDKIVPALQEHLNGVVTDTLTLDKVDKLIRELRL